MHVVSLQASEIGTALFGSGGQERADSGLSGASAAAATAFGMSRALSMDTTRPGLDNNLSTRVRDIWGPLTSGGAGSGTAAGALWGTPSLSLGLGGAGACFHASKGPHNPDVYHRPSIIHRSSSLCISQPLPPSPNFTARCPSHSALRFASANSGVFFFPSTTYIVVLTAGIG